MASNRRRAGFLRRMAALFYDGLLLFAVIFFATLALLPFTGGRAIPPNELLYTGYLVAVSFLYFGWFWTHGGQTLGMRAWRIRVQRDDGGTVTWQLAFVRFCSAILSWLPLGAGYLWMLVDRRGLAWHDRWSGTVVVLVPPSDF
ncbi:MAG: RDD family protein [Gammaproteobacteria bacterium]